MQNGDLPWYTVNNNLKQIQVSHEKNPPTFYYTGWLIGILIMVYYNPPYNWVVFHPLYNPGPTKGPFLIAQVNIPYMDPTWMSQEVSTWLVNGL